MPEPPITAEAVGAQLRKRDDARSAAVSAMLRDHVTNLDLMPGEVARQLLTCTSDQLVALANAGRLDMLVLDGRQWVNPMQVRELVLHEMAVRSVAAEAALDPARRALRGYLEATPATGDYAEARDRNVPLVCARRGRVYLHTGLEYHSVVAPVIAVSRWAAEHRGDDPGLAQLPAGSALVDVLTSLDGVGQQYTVTPQRGLRTARRVRNWIRVDPQYWPVRVPVDLLAELEREGTAAGGR